MKVSVIIPFRGDPATLLWTLEGFARQRLEENVSLDVRIGGDGCAPPDRLPAAESSAIRFSVFTFPRSGVAGTKNALLEGIDSDVLLFVNADTRPAPDLVSAHLRQILMLPEGTMVLGSAPYEPDLQTTVFDILKDQTPMIFFYHRLEPHRYCDYRHAWNLNVSVRSSDFRRVGGFSAALRPYGYEDLDFAFKVMGEKPAVYFNPDAAVLHRHPMSLEEYLDREEGLGSVAPNLLRVNPSVFQSLFGTADLAKLATDYRAWSSMDLASHRWTYQRLREWVTQPQTVLGTERSEERRRLLMSLYQMHIPLKRLAFRLGFLRGLDLVDDARWVDRGAAGLWREAVK